MQFTCHWCSAPFATKRSLNMHKVKSRHHEMQPSSSSNKSSGAAEDVKAQKIRLEVYLKHEQQKRSKCSFCEVRFTTKQTMKAHYLRAHFRVFQGIHIYSCSKCDFQTGNELSFMHHKAAVSDCDASKPSFQCQQCDQMFSQSKKLGPHMRENHNDNFKLPSIPQFKFDLPIPPCLLEQQEGI